MINHKTHFIGCEVIDNYKPSITDSHVLRLDSKNVWSYGPVLDNLSACCHLAYSMKDVTTEPFKVSVLVPFVKTRKVYDESTNVDVLDFLISKLMPPPNGIIFSIIQINMERKHVTPFFLANVWPFVDKWDPQNHISVQIPEPNVSDNKLNPLMRDWIELEKILKSFNKYDIKYVDYSMPIEEVYNTV